MSPFTNAYKNQIKAYNTCNSQVLFVRAQVENEPNSICWDKNFGHAFTGI